MKVSEIITADRPSLSFEVFPPKTSATYESIKDAVGEIAALSPSYMSVTYGAGGTTSEFTAAIAAEIMKAGVEPLAHLTCVCSTHDTIKERLSLFASMGVENILALRGDMPKDASAIKTEYRYASELVADIKEFGGFCIGGACYPEGHVESAHQCDDIKNLKEKVDAGLSFLTTQMFFDNNVFYNFLYKIRETGITIPVIAGIMPVTNPSQIKRIRELSGTFLPHRFLRIVDRYGDNPDAMTQAGIAYATEQVVDLYANGINAVHIYSMNKPSVAAAIKNNISHII